MFFSVGAQAAETMPVEVRVWNWNTSQLKKSFLAYPENNRNGADVAVGDFTGDGSQEIAIGAGRNSGPHVRIFSETGALKGLDFFPFKPEYHGGLSIAAGDVTGDGRAELVVAPRTEAQARIRVYKTNAQREIVADFLAYPESFQGGANVTLGDFNGDGKAEIAVAPGNAGAPLIRIFDQNGRSLGKDFYAFGKEDKGGASVAAADFDGDGIDELIVGHGPYGEPWVKTYRVDQKDEVVVGTWLAFGRGFRGGVKVAAADLDHNGRDEVLVAPGPGGGPNIRGFTPTGTPYKVNNMVYGGDFRGGFNLAAGDLNNDGKTEIVTVPDKKLGDGRLDYFRYIDVSIPEQRLRTYENAMLVKTFLVSTGTTKFPTPTGTFSVKGHILNTRMSWEYGPNHPENYDLPNVPHVLPFYGAYTIHGAYWHNNWGHRMSHGCINVSLPEAAWLYNWARNGDPVIVR